MMQTNPPSLRAGLRPAYPRGPRGGPSGLSNTVALLLVIALATYAFERVEHEPARSHHLGAESVSAISPLAAPFNRPIELESDRVDTCDDLALCVQTNSTCTDSSAFVGSCPGELLNGSGIGMACEKTGCNALPK